MDDSHENIRPLVVSLAGEERYMPVDDEIPHWSSDPYWVEALEAYDQLRGQRRRLVLDLKQVEREIVNGDGPAYRLVDAMHSVRVHDGADGYRGAPRLVLALLARLSELSTEPRP
jgi:hypothetical protein